MTEFEITTVDIPPTIDPTGSDEFCQATTLRNHVEALIYGTTDTALDAVEELALWQPSKFEHYQMLVATVDGRVVGRGDYETSDGDDADTAWISVNVHPDYRRRGIGSALLVELESLAQDDGKRQAHTYAPAALGDGPMLDAPTGFGSVPRDNPETQFMLARGFSFEQVERVSRLPLPVAGLRSLVDNAIDRSTRDYALHEWVNECPEQWREDLAVLYTRMSTDAPSAGLEPPEDVWTVDRLHEDEARLIQSTITALFAAVEHVATGTLVGFTGLGIPRDTTRAVTQLDTLVRREHRGHKLGMLLKVANLAHLERFAPGHPSVITYNAEENRHMLAVNESVGFVPIGHDGVWKRLLR
jgi:GNAT superfamily N-acetyltransferase